MMKRSVINRSIEIAKRVFEHNRLRLPAFALWTPAEWNSAGPEADEVRDCMLMKRRRPFGKCSSSFALVIAIPFWKSR